MRSTCYVPSFNFFLRVVSEIQRYKVFPFVKYGCHTEIYGVIIIKTFYMSSRTNGEKFISIWQAVAEKNMKVLFSQTDKQIDKQTNKQTNK